MNNLLPRALSISLLTFMALLGVYAASFSIADARAEVLWTDALVFLLLFSILTFAVSAYGKVHLREPWRQVFQHKLGVAAFVILVFYTLTGLLDSIHFRERLENNGSAAVDTVRYSNETLSVLDLFLYDLRGKDEKTYSAPFATHSYSKENIEISPGVMQRQYARLQFGGSHLSDVDGKWLDVTTKAAAGVFLGLCIFVILLSGIAALIQLRLKSGFVSVFRYMWSGQSPVPWRVVAATLLSLCILAGLIKALAPYYHILGTDKVGQDVLYQAIKSIRTGLVIGTLTTLVMLPFAVLLGIMAGYFKGLIDDVIQYLYTTLSSIPGVLLIAAAILTIQVYMANHPEMFDTDAQRADVRLFFLCLILGITSWTGLCRMLRGEALKLRESDYVSAAVALGVRPFTLLRKHIQPNVMHIVLIAVVLDFSGLVLAEAVLSYVGVGVDPTMHSWGNMINGARLEMSREPIVWWSLLAAFIFMFVLVLAANLFADAVRDAFDPRLRKQ